MRFDVAVVGGGVIGWSCAWHLLRRQPNLRVAVIEPDPTASSALRGTGGARAQFGSRVNIEFSRASIEEFKNFREEVGHDIGFRQVGYLFFTGDEANAARMRASVRLQRECGVSVQELTGGEISARAPYLVTDDLVYGTFCPTDGLLSAPDVLIGYRRGAIKLGAVEIRAAALQVEAGAVRTVTGEIWAGEIVVATGHWSSELRLDLPVRAEMHQLYVRHGPTLIPDDAPMIVDVDSTFHFRRRGEETIMGLHDSELAARRIQIYEGQPAFDPNAFDHMAKHGGHRCPIIFDGWTQSSIRGWAGCYCATPDHLAILGRSHSLIIATGFGGHGVMHSPAAGRIVADLIVEGSTDLDIRDLDPGRFAHSAYRPVSDRMVF